MTNCGCNRNRNHNHIFVIKPIQLPFEFSLHPIKSFVKGGEKWREERGKWGEGRGEVAGGEGEGGGGGGGLQGKDIMVF